MAGTGFIERHDLWSDDQRRLAADLKSRVEREGIQLIRLAWADPHGASRAKAVSPSTFLEVLLNGYNINVATFTLDHLAHLHATLGQNKKALSEFFRSMRIIAKLQRQVFALASVRQKAAWVRSKVDTWHTFLSLVLKVRKSEPEAVMRGAESVLVFKRAILDALLGERRLAQDSGPHLKRLVQKETEARRAYASGLLSDSKSSKRFQGATLDQSRRRRVLVHQPAREEAPPALQLLTPQSHVTRHALEVLGLGDPIDDAHALGVPRIVQTAGQDRRGHMMRIN